MLHLVDLHGQRPWACQQGHVFDYLEFCRALGVGGNALARHYHGLSCERRLWWSMSNTGAVRSTDRGAS